MSQQDLLERLVRFLDEQDVPYMLTGSLASSLHGEPRATHDIDVVVDMSLEAVEALGSAFPSPEFYVSPEAAREAVAEGGMFNLIATDEGDKIDFWMLTDEPFDASRFPRRQVEHVLGLALRVQSPEDTILAKLSWSKLAGGSEKHFQDALRIYEVRGAVADVEYLDEWAERLDVKPLWQRLRAEAEVLD